jgi:hypothetical protein
VPLKQGGGQKRKKEASLYLDNVAAGSRWHSREMKLKKSKCEDGLAPLG